MKWIDGKSRVIGIFVVSIGLAGCGGSNGAVAPATPVAISDIGGTWTQANGTRTWSLTQVGIQVGGPASISQDSNQNFGAVSGTGSVVGSAAFSTFTFEESYEHLSTSNPNCYITVDGQLIVSGNSMTGTFVEVDACAGVRLGQITGRLTMQRK